MKHTFIVEVDVDEQEHAHLNEARKRSGFAQRTLDEDIAFQLGDVQSKFITKVDVQPTTPWDGTTPVEAVWAGRPL